ncbi:hypothetical protein FVB32_13500 [Flagellimonas hymeniacidonis]|uniref:Lipoprotein n=1 Tax=Flagellimonas hymeniacidonis TaxID=2603628 RepID=A0A5C8V1X7_9FLAO|nr:hypothetical protein [Flagellimonas hymeniacidonis]TXN35590.1 hypothetical protein FVB32_13500 [Flagellimonas hymeniacidonis]
MIPKPIFKISFLWIIVTLFGCTNKKGTNKDALEYSFNNGRDIVYSLNQLFNEQSADSENTVSLEAVTALNDKVVSIIESINTPNLLEEVSEHYSRKKPSFLLATSDDGRIAVFSWHLPKGNLNHTIRNQALYSIDGKVTPITLYGEPLNLTDIYTLKTEKGTPIYILDGWEEATELTYRNRIDAYSISDNTASKANIFPNQKCSLISEYSVLGHRAHIKSSIEKDGSLILIPEIMGSKIVFSALEFDGTQYTDTYFKESLKAIHIADQGDLAQIRYD